MGSAHVPGSEVINVEVPGRAGAAAGLILEALS
jgi:hypothetical protein